MSSMTTESMTSSGPIYQATNSSKGNSMSLGIEDIANAKRIAAADDVRGLRRDTRDSLDADVHQSWIATPQKPAR